MFVERLTIAIDTGGNIVAGGVATGGLPVARLTGGGFDGLNISRFAPPNLALAADGTIWVLEYLRRTNYRLQRARHYWAAITLPACLRLAPPSQPSLLHPRAQLEAQS